MGKKKSKKLSLKLKILAVLTVILLLALTALVIVKVFVVKNVKILGNELYEDEQIISVVMNDNYSWNSLYVFLKYTIQDTENLPFIDTMEIHMESPDTICITVYEKGILGYLYIPAINENAYFDKEGIVVETSERILPEVPLVKGLDCNQVILHEKLPIDDKILRQLLTLTQTLKRDSLQPESILYENKEEPLICYGNVRVCLGSMENLTPKVERMKSILPSLEGMSGILHLESWTEESTNIVFEKTE